MKQSKLSSTLFKWIGFAIIALLIIGLTIASASAETIIIDPGNEDIIIPDENITTNSTQELNLSIEQRLEDMMKKSSFKPSAKEQKKAMKLMKTLSQNLKEQQENNWES